MTKSQRVMTDFFQPKKKKYITDYFKKEIITHKIVNTKSCLYQHTRDYPKARRYLNTHKRLYDAAKTQVGYFYYASANFTEYYVCTTRDQVITINNKDIFIPSGKKIAQAKVDSDSALEHISVDGAFQRQGIGKSLIKFINNCDKQFYIYTGVEHNSRYRLTNEGAQLIQACLRAGILNEEQTIPGVPSSPSSMHSPRSYR